MDTMDEIVTAGEKIHVITRRLFKDDVRRHFAGIVTAVNSVQDVIRAEGFTFVFESASMKYIRREDLRCRVISLIDAGVNITMLPKDVNIGQLRYAEFNGRLVVTDGKFKLDVNEFGPNF